jgi:hypothetical protein
MQFLNLESNFPTSSEISHLPLFIKPDQQKFGVFSEQIQKPQTQLSSTTYIRGYHITVLSRKFSTNSHKHNTHKYEQANKHFIHIKI